MRLRRRTWECPVNFVDGMPYHWATSEWLLGCQDSNLGMAAPKAAALPLGYTPRMAGDRLADKTKPNPKRIGLKIYPKLHSQSTNFSAEKAVLRGLIGLRKEKDRVQQQLLQPRPKSPESDALSEK